MSGSGGRADRRDREAVLQPPVRADGGRRSTTAGLAAAERAAPATVHGPVALRVPVRRVERSLLVAVAALMAAYATTEALRLAGNPTSLGMVNLFDVDNELSIPTWFSSMLLLACAAVAAAIAASPAERAGGDRRHWSVVAAVALAISVDEVAAYHESWTDRVGQIIDVGGLLSFAWVIPATAVLLLVVAVEVPFVRRLAPATRRRLVPAAAVLVAGGLGMEMVGGWYHDGGGGDDAIYGVVVGVEEGLEMLGGVLLLSALLRHLRTRSGEIRIDLRG